MSNMRVWATWRDEVEAHHPLPEAFDCLAYLSTETGEALDTGLRLKRPRDDRTNGHHRNLGRELAQVIDMAYASAIRYGIDLDAECDAWREEVRARGQR
jgi:hypothetical protein